VAPCFPSVDPWSQESWYYRCQLRHAELAGFASSASPATVRALSSFTCSGSAELAGIRRSDRLLGHEHARAHPVAQGLVAHGHLKTYTPTVSYGGQTDWYKDFQACLHAPIDLPDRPSKRHRYRATSTATTCRTSPRQESCGNTVCGKDQEKGDDSKPAGMTASEARPARSTRVLRTHAGWRRFSPHKWSIRSFANSSLMLQLAT